MPQPRGSARLSQTIIPLQLLTDGKQIGIYMAGEVLLGRSTSERVVQLNRTYRHCESWIKGQALWKLKIDQGRQILSGTHCPLAISVNNLCPPQLLKQYPFSQEGAQQHLYLIPVVAIVTKNSVLKIWPMQGHMLGEAALKHWHSISSLP